MESNTASALHSVPDDELLRRLAELVSQSRRVEAELVAHIGEVDGRRLYARFAFPSMFAYCTNGLRLSEAEAYRRITVARAARRYPVVLAMLRDGRVHLSGLATLVPLLTGENHQALLERATHRTKRQIEDLVAELAPRPDAATRIRRLPERNEPPIAEPLSGIVELVPGRVGLVGTNPVPFIVAPAPTAVAPAPDTLVPLPDALAPRDAVPSSVERPSARPVVEALSPGRYRVQFTASANLRDKLERLTALMRFEVPNGDLAAVIERAVSEKLERLEARRFARTRVSRQAPTAGGLSTPASTAASAAISTPAAASAPTPAPTPAPTSRHIPAAVRRAVAERDQARCRFVDEHGRRCSERHALQFHHHHPFGMGGDHTLANLSLMCAQHNRRLAEHDYGPAAIKRWTRKKDPVSPR